MVVMTVTMATNVRRIVARVVWVPSVIHSMANAQKVVFQDIMVFFCKQICSNNCKNSTCDQDSGRCLLGCEDGMRGTNCNEVCPAGTFGENCASTCSLCRNNLCDAKTGTCRFGCALGYSGPLCEDVVPLYGTSNNDFSQNDTITISSSVSASVLVTVIITVLVIIIVRRKKNICLCKKTRKRSKADKPDDNIENVDAHPAQSTAQLEIRTTAV